MRYNLRKHPNPEKRGNINLTATAAKVDPNSGAVVTILQKIGDDMNPTVRLVDIGSVELYQKKIIGGVNSKSNEKTGNYTVSTRKTTNSSTVKGTTNKVTVNDSPILKDKSVKNMQPVVRLVDCYESLFSLSAIIASAASTSASPPKRQNRAKSRGRPPRTPTTSEVKPLSPTLQDLKSRGLQEFKLSDLVKKSSQNNGPVINVKAITHLIVNVCTSGNAPNRHNRPFDLENPWEECLAITEALQIYAARVTPAESISLFEPTTTSSDPVVSKKTWQYLSTLGNSHFFFKMLNTPGANVVFESKMVGIMKAGVEVDAFNWTLTEVGSILGFWLAKLYNVQGISDDEIPHELNLAKQHFMELNGWEYDKAVVHDFPIN